MADDKTVPIAPKPATRAELAISRQNGMSRVPVEKLENLGPLGMRRTGTDRTAWSLLSAVPIMNTMGTRMNRLPTSDTAQTMEVTARFEERMVCIPVLTAGGARR